MLIKETWINRTENCGYGDSGEYEPFTDNIGKLFKALQKEHGRCQGKVYVDIQGAARQTGWVFVKNCQYTDTKGIYL